MSLYARIARYSEIVDACHSYFPWQDAPTKVSSILGIEVSYWSFDGVQIFGIETDEEVVIVFQGSRSVRDWLRNFDFPLVFRSDVTTGHFHRGFHRTANNQCFLLMDYVNSFCSAIVKPIVVTGHSHGSALASLCVPFFERKPDVFVFGSPYVCDSQAAFALENQAKIFCRITNHVDLVTWVNKRITTIKPAGIGKEIRIDKAGDLSIRAPDTNLPLKEAFKNLFAFDDTHTIWGHMPSAYARRMRQAILRQEGSASNEIH